MAYVWDEHRAFFRKARPLLQALLQSRAPSSAQQIWVERQCLVATDPLVVAELISRNLSVENAGFLADVCEALTRILGWPPAGREPGNDWHRVAPPSRLQDPVDKAQRDSSAIAEHASVEVGRCPCSARAQAFHPFTKWQF